MHFEERVRNIARAKWHLSPGDGGPQFINGQEIDCVAETEDLTHLIMCTVSRKTDKIKDDVEKLTRASRYLMGQGRLAKLWVIMAEEPSADQRDAARKGGVTAQSAMEFQRSLININDYFAARAQYRFGSAVDPVSSAQRLSDDEYVALPIADIRSAAEESTRSLTRRLEDGAVCALIGEFGAGKSLTAREIYFELRRRYFAAEKQIIPLVINLREHWGQVDIAEVLTRHAQLIGYSRPNDLVRAWNAGNCVAILDGFDELAIQSVITHPRTRRMARYAATQIIRAFIEAARGRTGVLVTGRAHYFDSLDELRSALGLNSDDAILELGSFTEAQASEYLRRKNVPERLPEWLPRTPLLLGYLAARRLLEDISELGQVETPAEAWDLFVDRISSRDAALGPDLDASTVRRLLERLATRTRLSSGGTRELDDADVGNAFREVTGIGAFDSTHVLLQRLPGLTSRTSQEGTRAFIDNEMLETLRASDVRNFLVDPYTPLVEGVLQHPLTRFGTEVLAFLSGRIGLTTHQHVSAAREAINRWHDGTLALDALMAGSLRASPAPLDCDGLTVTDGYLDTLDLDESGFNRLRLDGCAVSLLRLGSVEPGVELSRCLIGAVEGATSLEGLPTWIRDSDVDVFDPAATNTALLNLDIPLPVRVALTVLRKIFLQRGSGRRDGALRRGLDAQSRAYVDAALDLLRRGGFIWVSTHGGNRVWHGNPDMRSRASRILAAPIASGDPLIPELAELER